MTIISQETTRAIENAKITISGRKFYDKMTFKNNGVKMTKTENDVMGRIGSGLSLGFVSNAIVYSDTIRYWKVREVSALWSLLYRGELRLERVWSEQTGDDYVVYDNRVIEQPAKQDSIEAVRAYFAKLNK